MVGCGTQSVKPNLPDKKLKYSVNFVTQVMFSKTTANLKLRLGLVDSAGVNVFNASSTIKSIREWSLAVFVKDAMQQ
jgi:hypothetical protein